MNKAVLAALLLFSLLPARAADKIDGAFGLRFGQEFHPDGPAVDKLGYPGAFEYKPAAPNPAFGTYLVFLTPRTHRVYRLVAVATLPDEAAATRLLHLSAAFVQRKYSGRVYPTQLPGLQCTVWQDERTTSARSVTVSAGASKGLYLSASPLLASEVAPENKGRCDLSYVDSELSSQVLQEEQLNLIDGFDGTGL